MPASPSLRRRRLAAELRKLRDRSGLTAAEVAKELRWQESKISRVERRQSGITAAELRRLLDVYEVDDHAYRTYLTELARRGNERTWWDKYPRDVVGTEYADLISVEDEARAIRTYQQELVPGLVQTAEYARAVIRASRPSDTTGEIDRRVEVRMERQEILTRMSPPPPRLNAVLSEATIRRPIGGFDVMRGQLERLMKPRDRANVTIQVLPLDAGVHPSLVGPFALVTFPDPGDLGVVNLENQIGALFLEKTDELRVYEDLWNTLQAKALSPEDTQTFLKSTSIMFRRKEGI